MNPNHTTPPLPLPPQLHLRTCTVQKHMRSHKHHHIMLHRTECGTGLPNSAPRDIPFRLPACSGRSGGLQGWHHARPSRQPGGMEHLPGPQPVQLGGSWMHRSWECEPNVSFACWLHDEAQPAKLIQRTDAGAARCSAALCLGPFPALFSTSPTSLSWT